MLSNLNSLLHSGLLKTYWVILSTLLAEVENYGFTGAFSRFLLVVFVVFCNAYSWTKGFPCNAAQAFYKWPVPQSTCKYWNQIDTFLFIKNSFFITLLLYFLNQIVLQNGLQIQKPDVPYQFKTLFLLLYSTNVFAW